MLSADDVILRLEEAGRTLLSLPPERAPGHVRTTLWHHVQEPVHSMALPLRLRPTPSASDLTRMDEALAWLSLIPADKFVIRRIVAARSMVSPVNGKHLFPWRRVARLIGADHKAVQRWHEQGIDLISRALAARTQAVRETGRRVA